MPSSFVLWIAAGVLLFWSVGAYNRLVRLRAEANAAFAALDAEFSKQVDLVRACLAQPDDHPASQFDGQSSFWAGLHNAVAQFATSLSSARVKPLETEGIAALGAAHEVLAMAWERAERDDAHDLAGPRLPESVMARRGELVLLTHAATENFNQAVMRYNEGIAQFPAVVLAWLFGFKAARGLRARA